MALHDIREVRIPIELDKPRTLLFDLNAFAELEDKFGSLDQAFQKMQQGSVKATRTLLWAGLLHEDEKLTERQVGAMISLTNVEKIMEQITEALTAAHCGMPLLCLSVMTNMAAGVLDRPLTNGEVDETAKTIATRFSAYVTKIIGRIGEVEL